MPKKPYHVVPHGNQWAVKRAGNKRPTSKHGTQREAVDNARELAASRGTTVVMHRKDGTVKGTQKPKKSPVSESAKLDVAKTMVRSFYDNFNRLNASYDAASPTFDTQKLHRSVNYSSPISANNSVVRYRIRNFARSELLENNSYARGIVEAQVINCIGTGPVLQVTTENKSFNRLIEAVWAEWAESINLPSRIQQMYRAKIVDGEAFAEAITNDTLPTPVKLDIRLSEAELWTNRTMWNADNQLSVDGILYDRSGNPVSYQRLKYHPAESWPLGIRFNDDHDTIPASDVIHWFRRDRPDQRRGISEFVTALNLFGEHRRYGLAVLAAAETAANFSAVLETDAAAFQDASIDQKGNAAPCGWFNNEFKAADIERRLLTTLPHGWKMNQFKSEQPTTSYVEYDESIVKQAARCVLQPLNIAQGSSRNHNFASAKLDRLLFTQRCKVDQRDCDIEVCNRIWRWFITEASFIYPQIMARSEPITKRWTWPQSPPIDELKYAQSKDILAKLGYHTLQDEADERAMDVEMLQERLKADREFRESIGASLDGAIVQADANDTENRLSELESASSTS